MNILEEHGAVDLDDRQQSWRTEGLRSQEPTGAAATLPDGAVVSAAATSPSGSRDEKIELVEETLRVGKRVASGGRVRVRSYVVETPAEEEVSLREEHVEIERRPMDRASTGADEALFSERVIEATETSEEAVVAKEARVTEEVVVRKDVEERVETVHDTVRHTEVEVEDTRTTAAPPGGSTKSPLGRVDPAPRR